MDLQAEMPGVGCVSFKYSMMASDCDKTVPATSSAGMSPCGLSAR
jgi:hypothetical protein